MNNSQRLNSACGSSREEPSGHTHQPTVGHGLTSGGSPPQVGETPKNPNSACGTSREGALGVSSYATNHSGLDRPSYLPTTARLHLLDDQMLVPLGFRVRPLRDGGGKTSPGRVPPPLRPPTPLAEKGRLILTKVQSLTKDFLHSISKHEKHHPFSDDLLRDVRQILVGPTNETVTPGQPFYLDAIHDVAKQLQDADQDYPLTVKEGVPLGVTTPTLTSPGIWPTKAELKGEDPTLIDLPYPTGRANYSSAEQFTEDIKTTFREERALQMVEGPFTTTEAANYCGCAAEELCPGPMAAIDEGDKIRTIYDGSWGGANAHIQRNTEECTTAPTVMDCVHCIHWLRAARGIPPPERAGATGPDTCDGGRTNWVWPTPTTQWSILKADVTKAHRRIKIHQEDWKFQVAHIGDEWWVNKVGTYGMASAQLYWGRMAALLLRIVYAIFPGIDWGFVFVDDFAWLIREPQSAIYSTAILVLLLSLGTPLSWKKTVLNPVNTWLGFVIDPTGPIVQMATDKNSLVLNLLDKLAAGDVFTLKDLEKGMGRLQWATSACPLTKPLLQPLWQWKGVLRSSGRPNHLIRVFARMLRLLFQEPYVQPTPYAPWSPWHGASDASASHQKEYYIGGWLSSEPTPSKGTVHWFHLRLEESNFPWLFKTKTASAMIPALELLGSLILIAFILRMGERHQLAVRIPVITDNQGNVFCMLNNKTRQMPTAAILMQLVLTLHKGGAQLAPSHVKRDLNQWADELTHPNPTGFNPDYCLDAKTILKEFTLMNWVLKEIYHH